MARKNDGQYGLRKEVLKGLISSRRFEFHRSPATTNVGLSAVKVLDDVTAAVSYESHGASPIAGSTFRTWSNDGDFVYYDDAYTERCTCASSDTESLGTFKSKSFGGDYHILWRPAYNLFPATTNGKTITYTKSTPPRSDGSKAGFDQRDATVLRSFLSN
jgi:hypothetical protein